ncbi:MAG: 4Fe-4S binding protein [Gordonibacter sp.]|uniref:4Fe-4S binding protein n=1 Tax=Gordonibacter sp. TaxID=1968902 RepID=UPI002FC6DA64
MPNATSIFGLLEKLNSTDIVVHQNRCAVVRNRNATCSKCVEACTSGCLSYDNNELVVSPEKCIGCGTCATVCPTCAIEAQHPTDAELLQSCTAVMRATDGEVVIACEQILGAADGLYDPAKVVGVVCLGRVEESLIAALAGAGAKQVSLVQAKCSACAHAKGLATAKLVCETANTLLDTWNSSLRARVTEKLPAVVRRDDESFDVRRRDFFSTVRDEATSAAAVTADYAVREALHVEDEVEPKYVKVGRDGTLPHQVPDRRVRLLASLSELGKPQDVMIETRLWGHVVIELDRCSSCQMCATFCPTGAISKFEDADGVFGIQHNPGKCVKCLCCTDICVEDALWISDEVFAVDLLDGKAERYEMQPQKNPPNNPHAILHAVKDLIGMEQVYER